MNKIHFLRISRIILLAITAGLLPPCLALADSLTVDIATGAYLFNADTSDVRALMQFDLPSELDSAEIVFAELTVPIGCVIPDSSAMALYCQPLLIGWNPIDVAWENLGDSLTDAVIGEGTLFATSYEGWQTAYFDVTGILRSWQDRTIANNGMLFYYDNSMLPYLTFDYERRLFGQVKIIYSSMN